MADRIVAPSDVIAANENTFSESIDKLRDKALKTSRTKLNTMLNRIQELETMNSNSRAAEDPNPFPVPDDGLLGGQRPTQNRRELTTTYLESTDSREKDRSTSFLTQFLTTPTGKLLNLEVSLGNNPPADSGNGYLEELAV